MRTHAVSYSRIVGTNLAPTMLDWNPNVGLSCHHSDAGFWIVFAPPLTQTAAVLFSGKLLSGPRCKLVSLSDGAAPCPVKAKRICRQVDLSGREQRQFGVVDDSGRSGTASPNISASTQSPRR